MDGLLRKEQENLTSDSEDKTMQKMLFAIAGLGFSFLTHPVLADEAAFVEACLSSTNIERSTCECTAQKAKQELSPKGFEFVVATLRRDDPVTAKLRAEMTVQELTQAGTFMAHGPKQCTQES